VLLHASRERRQISYFDALGQLRCAKNARKRAGALRFVGFINRAWRFKNAGCGAQTAIQARFVQNSGLVPFLPQFQKTREPIAATSANGSYLVATLRRDPRLIATENSPVFSTV
jgi:hypothetical protein